MKKYLCLLFTFCLFSNLILAQGSDCSTATAISNTGNYAGTTNGFSSQYWLIMPTMSGTINIGIESASSCGIVVDIVEFTDSQMNNCIPPGEGSEGRIVSNSSGGCAGFDASSMALSVTAGRFYYLRVAAFFVDEAYTLTIDFGEPLAAQLIQQQVSYQQGKALITWQTTTENDLSHFTIERSTNGRTFQVIGTVNTNASNDLYHFEDANLQDENYYKVVQHHLNGTSTAFDLLYLKRPSFLNDIQVYQQQERLTIACTAAKNQQIQTQIANAMGQILLTQTIELKEGFNQFSLPVIGSGYQCITIWSEADTWGQSYLIK